MKARHASPSKRRTTLTLPADALAEAQRIARSRNSTLSTVVADALAQGLETNRSRARSAQVIKDYQQALQGFSDEEIMILDGIIPERRSKR